MGHADQVSIVSTQIGTDPDFDVHDMSYIGAISQDPASIVVMDHLEIDGWEALVDRLPDLSIATQGASSYAHVLTLALAEVTDAISFDEMNFVHYDGTGEALSGLERGEADLILTGLTSGVSVAQALDAEVLIGFTSPDVGAEVLGADEHVRHYSTEMDVEEGFEEYADIATTQRLYVGPPDVDDDILDVQRDTLEQVIRDDEFLEEAREAGRPILEPTIGSETIENMEAQYNTFSSGELGDAIRDAF